MGLLYSEKLKLPAWQKKRLEILNRDEFTCRVCGDKEKTLHVHHLYYDKRNEPWEYPDISLVTLCVDCHNNEHESRPDLEYDLLLMLKQRGMLCSDLREFISEYVMP